jgi:ATP-binding protein involved in chromosome partitioning
MPFLGEIPLDPAVREGGDGGRPAVLGDDETAVALSNFADKTANMQGIVHRQRISRKRG